MLGSKRPLSDPKIHWQPMKNEIFNQKIENSADFLRIFEFQTFFSIENNCKDQCLNYGP